MIVYAKCFAHCVIWSGDYVVPPKALLKLKRTWYTVHTQHMSNRALYAFINICTHMNPHWNQLHPLCSWSGHGHIADDQELRSCYFCYGIYLEPSTLLTHRKSIGLYDTSWLNLSGSGRKGIAVLMDVRAQGSIRGCIRTLAEKDIMSLPGVDP